MTEVEEWDVFVFEHNYGNKARQKVQLEDIVIRDVGEKVYWIDVWGKEGLSRISCLGLNPDAIASIEEDTNMDVLSFKGDLFRFDLGNLVFDDWVENWDFTVQKVHCLLGARFLLTFHEERSRLVEKLIDHYVTDFSATSKAAVFLVYEMFHHMLDSYLRIHQSMQDKLKELDNSVITADQTFVLEASRLHTDFLVMREIDHTARNVLNYISSRANLFVSANTKPFLANMSMVLERLEDDLVTDRQVTSDTVNLFVSIINFRMSITMKKMAGVNIIMSGITLLTAVYLAIPQHGSVLLLLGSIITIVLIWIWRRV